MKLDELRKIAEARTKGEWVYSVNHSFNPVTMHSTKYERLKSPHKIINLVCESDSSGQFKFLAASANHFDAFLRLLEAAKKVEATIRLMKEHAPSEIFKDVVGGYLVLGEDVELMEAIADVEGIK